MNRETITKSLKTVGCCVLIPVLGSIAAALLLTLAVLLPVNQEKAQASLEVLELEGEYPLANVAHNYGNRYFALFEPSTLDVATDYRMLYTVLTQSGESNPLAAAMDMQDYARYWHGYLLILKPLLYLMDYWELRILNSLLQTALAVIIAIVIWEEKKQKRYVLAFLTSYALLMPMAVGQSLQYSSVFYLSFLGILYAVRHKSALAEKSRYVYFFLILGMLTSFFDLLTYPLAVWGLPLIWWFVALGDRLDGKQRVKKIAASAGAWVFGYGFFWVLKWILATLILGRNVIADAIESIFYRVGEVDEYAKALLQAYHRWEVLYTNWRVYENGVFSAILIAWVVWGIYHHLRGRWEGRPGNGACLLISLSSLVWYLVLSNHTTIHHIFTYRIYNVAILAVIIFIAESVPAHKAERAGAGGRGLAFRLVYWGVCGVIGFVLAMQIRENVDVIYGAEHTELEMDEQDVAEVSFVPTCSEIRSIGFCILSETGEGAYRVELLQDGEARYQMEIPLENHREQAYHEEDVVWKLSAGTEYTMRITPVNIGEPVRLLVTEPGNMPLNEYRSLSINGVEAEGQPLGSFCYHARVQSKWRIGYAALMCAAYIGFLGAGITGKFFQRQTREDTI